MYFTSRCDDHSVMPNRCRTRSRLAAFSLIEMLVVVTLIVLLLGMLLPSFKSAREQAKVVVCSASTSGIAKAAAGYTAEWDGWLCGSPGTSGSVMYQLNPRPDPADEQFAMDPSQIWDWAGPLAARYMKWSLSANRAERYETTLGGVFRCPSNSFEADPFPAEVGSYKRLPMVSYNTFRNFLMWSRTMVDRNPAKPWGVRAPHPEASFDRIGGRTLQPKQYAPNINRITNASAKVYLADGNRFTEADGRVTYDLEWDALDGGAFCNGGPTLREWDGIQFVLSSYHFNKQLGKYGYRHHAKGERGMVVNYFDGHAEIISESESRQPDRWWPKGTVIPSPELNDPSKRAVQGRFDSQFNYVVGR